MGVSDGQKRWRPAYASIPNSKVDTTISSVEHLIHNYQEDNKMNGVIGFINHAKNNEIPLDQEMAIKRKVAQWMDLSFRNVDQYEMVMKEN